MANTKKFVVQNKFVSVPAVKAFIIYNDSEDAKYVSSQCRYGRQNLSSRQYVYNDLEYVNHAEWLQAMQDDNYDIENPNGTEIRPSLFDNISTTKDEMWDLYCTRFKHIKLNETSNKLHGIVYEANRLLSLKSERSHNKGHELIANATELLNTVNREIRSSASNSMVTSFFWDSHNDANHQTSKSNAKYNTNSELKTSWKISYTKHDIVYSESKCIYEMVRVD
jgi:hypothetical protein